MSQDQNTQNTMTIDLRGQYIKDLSFENFDPDPDQAGSEPIMDVDVKVGGRHLNKKYYESTLHIKTIARKKDKVVFIIEVTYAGVYEVQDPESVDENRLQKFLYTNSPQLLFPFVRRIIADTTRDGNMPPLLLSPPDFNRIYEEEVKTAKTINDK